MNSDRWRIERSFRPHVGWCSILIDTLTRRTIVIAGKDHDKRAGRRRVELENAAAAVRRERP